MFICAFAYVQHFESCALSIDIIKERGHQSINQIRPDHLPPTWTLFELSWPKISKAGIRLRRMETSFRSRMFLHRMAKVSSSSSTLLTDIHVNCC